MLRDSVAAELGHWNRNWLIEANATSRPVPCRYGYRCPPPGGGPHRRGPTRSTFQLLEETLSKDERLSVHKLDADLDRLCGEAILSAIPSRPPRRKPAFAGPSKSRSANRQSGGSCVPSWIFVILAFPENLPSISWSMWASRVSFGKHNAEVVRGNIERGARASRPHFLPRRLSQTRDSLRGVVACRWTSNRRTWKAPATMCRSADILTSSVAEVSRQSWQEVSNWFSTIWSSTFQENSYQLTARAHPWAQSVEPDPRGAAWPYWDFIRLGCLCGAVIGLNLVLGETLLREHKMQESAKDGDCSDVADRLAGSEKPSVFAHDRWVRTRL